MNITDYAPLIIRYGLVSLASMMAARGWLNDGQNAILSENLDVIVGAIVGLGTVGYAMFKRPSKKALKAAKAIDKQIPASEDVVIVTPGTTPNIHVPAK